MSFMKKLEGFKVKAMFPGQPRLQQREQAKSEDTVTPAYPALV